MNALSAMKWQATVCTKTALVCAILALQQTAVLAFGDVKHRPSSSRLSEIVDTRIGTGGFGFGVGSVNPGPQVPFGRRLTSTACV